MNISELSFAEKMAIVRSNPKRDSVLNLLNEISDNRFVWVKKQKVKRKYKCHGNKNYSTIKIKPYA